MSNKYKIGVIGLGYVGLPVAIGFAGKYEVVGFDINPGRIAELSKGIDVTNEVEKEAFENIAISFTDKASDLADCNFYVVAVPTPVDADKQPNLTPLESASETVATVLKPNDIVVYESTVFPGCTEEICIPILERGSNLSYPEDFQVGYSPERINPGDKLHTLTKITKVVSAGTPEALEVVAELYDSIIEAGVHKASSIKVAEAAKIIENTQRDLNIALMNELAIVFDKMNINTHEVLKAAGTKWNFLNFYPGLVGGHCIGVDPYYLTYKAEQLGHEPDVILSGRKLNDNLPYFIVDKSLKALTFQPSTDHKTRVLVKGVSFKANVSDIRNSKVFDVIRIFEERNCEVDVVDDLVNKEEVKAHYGVELKEQASGNYDIIVMTVPHNIYLDENLEDWLPFVKEKMVFFDIMSKFAHIDFPDTIEYLSL